MNSVYTIGFGVLVGFIFVIIFMFLVGLLATLLFGNITVGALNNLIPQIPTLSVVNYS
jgi:uncharacterized membrane protein